VLSPCVTFEAKAGFGREELGGALLGALLSSTTERQNAPLSTAVPIAGSSSPANAVALCADASELGRIRTSPRHRPRLLQSLPSTPRPQRADAAPARQQPLWDEQLAPRQDAGRTCLCDERRVRDKRFQTAPFPARARRAVIGNRRVPELACAAAEAAADIASGDDAEPTSRPIVTVIKWSTSRPRPCRRSATARARRRRRGRRRRDRRRRLVHVAVVRQSRSDDRCADRPHRRPRAGGDRADEC